MVSTAARLSRAASNARRCTGAQRSCGEEPCAVRAGGAVGRGCAGVFRRARMFSPTVRTARPPPGAPSAFVSTAAPMQHGGSMSPSLRPALS